MVRTILMPNFMFVINYVGNNNDCIIQKVSRNLDISYSHTVKVIKGLKDEECLLLRKNGRVINLTLTSKGWQLFHPINKIMEVMGVTIENSGKYRYQGKVHDES